jgi:hypothetical protein
MPDADNITTMNRISILLEEYRSIRGEINNRTGYGFQVTALITAAITFLLNYRKAEYNIHNMLDFWIFIGSLAFMCAIAIWFFLINIRDLKKAANHAKNLEIRINEMVGEHLLTWEQLSGPLTQSGFGRSLISKTTPLSAEKLPGIRSASMDATK